MQISCSTDGIVSSKFPKAGMRDIADGGYSQVVLNISRGAFDYRSKRRERLQDNWIFSHAEELQKILEPTINAAQENNLEIIAAYANFTPPNLTAEDDMSDVFKVLSQEALDIAINLGCKYLILRPISSGIGDADIWTFNRDYYLELAKIAKDSNLMILLESQTKNTSIRHRGLCTDPVEVVKWIDSLNEAAGEERFGFSMDVGTCSLFGQNMYEVAVTLGSRLKMAILRDSDTKNESSMLPFTSVYEGSHRTDWFNFIRGMRAINFDGLLTMQIADTAAAFSPLIRADLLKLSKTIVTDYLIYQIDIEHLLRKYPSLVIFGAGYTGMNFINRYGEIYQPLFACDNNKKLWNMDFYGLKVEPPEKLKDIPEDCLILICNNFYSEIETQLRDMGLKNPIELFNG